MRTRKELELEQKRTAVAPNTMMLLSLSRQHRTTVDDANDNIGKTHLFKHILSKKNRVMLVGWGGNNGTTVTAGILANKL